mgnify:FL=1
MIKAIGNNVLLRQTMTAEKKSSIILADGAKDDTKYAIEFEVLSIGDGPLYKESTLKVGDNVFLDRTAQASHIEEIERKQGELVILEGIFFVNDIVGIKN